MKKKTISALTIATLAGSLGVSKAAVLTSRADRRESAARAADQFAPLQADPSIAAASGDRPGDEAPAVMKSSSKKSSSKKKTTKAS